MISLPFTSKVCTEKTYSPIVQSSKNCPCVSSPPSAAFIVVLLPTSVERAKMALKILKMKSLRPVHSRMASVTTQPGLEWLTTTFPFLDAVTCSAISWMANISRSFETLYLGSQMNMSITNAFGRRRFSYLSSIFAFFSSARASKMFSSSRSGSCVNQWTKDVTNTSLISALGQPFSAPGTTVR